MTVDACCKGASTYKTRLLFASVNNGRIEFGGLVLKTRVSLILPLVALPATLGLFITPLAVQAGKIREGTHASQTHARRLGHVPGIRTNIAWGMLLAGWVPAASAQLRIASA